MKLLAYKQLQNYFHKGVWVYICNIAIYLFLKTTAERSYPYSLTVWFNQFTVSWREDAEPNTSTVPGEETLEKLSDLLPLQPTL